MRLTVANASPLIALARIDQFILLKQLFEPIAIPKAVWDEVVVQDERRNGMKVRRMQELNE
jgi:predicted nucleic acid-binding protein